MNELKLVTAILKNPVFGVLKISIALNNIIIINVKFGTFHFSVQQQFKWP